MTEAIEGFHLSPPQQRLWALQQQGSPGAYRVRFALRLSGELDRERLGKALRLLVERHEILRTRFEVLPGLSVPLQVIASPGGPDLVLEDLTSCPAGEAEARLDALVDGAEPWGNGAEPLSARLLALSLREHLLVLAAPSLCLDRPSIALVTERLVAAYGDPAADGEEVLQYPEISDWQNGLLAGGDGDGPRYWRTLSLSSLGALRLACERAGAGETVPSATAPTSLPPDLDTALAQLARRLGVTLEALLLAAWQAVLRRLAREGGAEVITGVTLDGRNYEELRDALGPLSRCVPVVSSLDWDLRFDALARQVEAALENARSFQEYFSWETAGEERTEEPFFPYGFELAEQPADLAAAGVSFALERQTAWSERFALQLVPIRCGARPLALRLAFDASRFDPADVRRLDGQLIALLESAAAPGAAPPLLADLEVLGGEERRQVLGGFNDTRADYGEPVCLHQRVELQARLRPDAVAAVYEDREITFAELDARANRLARHLLTLGAVPGERIALYLERSLELLVALLATLKAGAAYLPLDPAHPREHVDFLLADARPAAVLTERRFASSLPPGPARVVELDAEAAAISQWSGTSPQSPVDGESLAYTLYTSGSTGRPKAVMIPHRAIANRLLWMQSAFPLDTGDRVLQKTPAGFDASVWELFSPLLAGARLVMARPGGHQDSAYLARAVTASGITVLQLVPSLLGVFLSEPEAGGCVSLRRLFCGGEALSTALAERCRAVLPWVALTNLYGPTEAAIDATFYPLHDGLPSGTVPIGSPLGNVQVYVLGAGRRPLPVGVPGELCIGGAGLAHGYLGRSELTAERFGPDPFGKPGARLYHTGDLARWRPDGALEYLGRIDRQVKLRGVRIELGEVEAALCRHPGVMAAAAVVDETPAGERRLIGYFTAAGDQAPDAAELRRFLLERLPEPLVPSVLFLLPAMPLTRSGKLDRRALPAPAELAPAGEAVASAAASPSRQPLAELLAVIWGQLLGIEPVERIGTDADFFDNGGHSLLAMQMSALVRKTFGVELSLRTIFEAPTLGGVAAAIEAACRGAQGAAPPLAKVPRDGGLPLSFSQERLWFLDRLVPESSFYNIPAALHITTPLDPGALERSFRRLVQRHESLRTRFAEGAGGPVQIVVAEPGFTLPFIDLAALPRESREREVRRLAAVVAGRPFDLGRAPLLRVVLLGLGDEGHALALAIHHIVADGWSIEILVEEMTELLAAEAAGREPVLTELPIQYADYAAWQRRWLAGEVLEEQLAYWRGRLASAPVALEMPTDRPRPAVQTFTGSRVYLRLPGSCLAAVKNAARQQGVTDFMLLLAVFDVLLHRYSGQPDLVVGTPIANRTRPEVQGIVGFFLNTLALRADLAGDPTFEALLTQVRESAVGGYVHQEVPFEKLVEELQPERNLSHQPLFQVMFVHQHAPRRAWGSPLAAARSIEAATDSAKFDLTLALEESGGALIGSLEHNTDLFDRTTAARLAEHFQVLLTALVERTGERISALPLVTAAERHQMLLDWNDTARPAAAGPAIHRLFEEQARRSPEAVAVVCDGRELTYAELDRWANRLAHRLRGLGIGEGDWVALFLDRSLEMIPALLAILKAGAAYLPIETTVPEERIHWLLAAQRVRCVLTQSRHEARLAALERLPDLAHLVCLDRAAELDGLPAEPPIVDVGPESIAYVIFTSGSTGTPKGVVVQHGPVVNLIDWVNREFQVGAADRVLFITSLSFDLSVYDVFGLLAAGGSIEVVTEEALREPELLLRMLWERPVTFWDSAPAALQQLAPLLSPERGGGAESRLRLVFLSGDWIPVGLPDRVRAFFPGARVIGLGGATEATVWSNFFPIGEVDPRWSSIPYGRPIQNARYHVLDTALEPCPIGVIGDLHIGGDVLCTGYCQQPGTTAERFIPDLFGAPGGRLYATGDRVLYRRDGNLEFMGRLDHQVKIRGFRIELGEIEVALAQHPAVGVAVVLAHGETRGDKVLAAYLVPRHGEPVSREELRRHLGERLPAYMIPAAFVFLDVLPVTANGKLDRRALPSPFGTRSESATEAPQNPLELQMLQIWEQVLGVTSLGVGDNFFDLGGHSILAVRLMAAVERRFGRELPLATLFRAPTVRDLAAALREERQGGPAESPSVLVPIQPQGSKTPLFFVHPIGGHVLCYVPLARRLPWDRPVYGFESAARTGGPLATSVEEMAERYVAELLAVQPDGPYLLGGMSSGGVVAFEMAQQLRRSGREVALLALLDSRPPAFGPWLDELLEDAAMLAGWGREIEMASGRSLGVSYEQLQRLAPDEQLALLLQRLQEAGLLPPEVGMEQARHLVHLLKTNLRAVESYVPQFFPGRITLFRAAKTDLDKLSETELTRRVLEEVARHPTYGWSELSTEPVDLCHVPGDHLSMGQEPHVAALAESLQARLDALERGAGVELVETRTLWAPPGGGAMQPTEEPA